MNLHETVELCARCEELTPHSRRQVPVARLIGLAALSGAAWCFLSRSHVEEGGVLLLLVASIVLVRDRKKLWRIRCERCRGKRRAELRRVGFKLDRNTVTTLS